MSCRVIELPEYDAMPFAKEDLAEDVVRSLYALYPNQVAVEPPSFLNGYVWKLKSQGWVGYIPISDTVHFSLSPKVPIRNLFGMLEYAYNLKGFRILDGSVDSESIEELFDRLAQILAKRVLARVRRGVYRAYLGGDDNLPYVRGRIDLCAHLKDPARVTLPCNFEEHTSDLEDNQILLWTMTRILECGMCTERGLPYVRQARRVLQGFACTKTFSAQSCVGRLYNRLNDDYAPMHALCRFFLENAGPTHRAGDRRMLPILVDMAHLFELFVAEWLKSHIPPRYRVRDHVVVRFDMGQILSIDIDLTIEDQQTGQTLMVLDTKYKAPEKPASDDIQQIVAYAAAKGCNRAVLIYPANLAGPITGHWGHGIHVEALTFRLDGDLEESGQEFLAQLLPEEGGQSAATGGGPPG